MARIQLVGVDLFLRGKLEALLPEHHFATADGVDPPDLVIVDVSRVDPVGRREPMLWKQGFQLSAKEEINPDELDPRHWRLGC